MAVMRSAARGRTARAIVFVIALAAASLIVVSAGSAARQPAPVPGGALDSFKPAFTPLGMSNRLMTVMLQVAGDPVTAVDASTPLTKDQKQALKDQLAAKQQPIESQVQAAGGTVLGTYQSAYNGIKVAIPMNKAKALAGIQGVVAVRPLQLQRPDNIHGVPLVGGPAAWDGLAGIHGEGLKIAVIDTGIDYTHADFGGSGNPADYQAALSSDTLAPNPLWFGASAPRVKGGIDLVGDSYNADPTSASYQPIPHPDPNPLDCNGHGTHTAGTAAGSGVLLNGGTYAGPYNASTVSGNNWLVGPGVAPKADIYSIRVFGCEGSTDETVDAIEWAVDHNMDVINMSLGSSFGSADEPSAVAATNAAKDGVIVVASAGNSGQNPYLAGSPSTGDGALSVAANDPTPGFPGADIALSTGSTLQAIDANGIPVNSLTAQVKVLKTPSGGISLGCDPNEYLAAGVTGKIVVTARGTCARVARAIFGQKAGAVAVVMVNNANTLPPAEGPITSNPDTGEPFTVTIPFLGVKSSDGAALLAADGGTATLTDMQLANPGFLAAASFTSGGARTGDSALKPEVTAPGVSIASAGMGTGTGFAVMSGTSMAAPHTAGAAVLVRQAHPDWKKVAFWKAALENTADPGLVADYSERVAGAGLIQVQKAVKTNVVALDGDQPTVNFGFQELDRDFAKKDQIKLRNFGDAPATFMVSDTLASGSPHSIVLKDAQVTVPAHGDKDVEVELDVPAPSAGDGSSFTDVGGQIVFTPAGSDNNGVTLRVPYYLVPQAVSKISTKIDTGQLRKNLTAVATVSNDKSAPVAGTADWYAWGLSDSKDHGLGSNDLVAAGAQAFPGLVAFAIQTQHRWSSAAMDEFDVLVDVNRDGTPDYDVVGVDYGLVTADAVNGQDAVAVFDLRTGKGSIQFLADAPTDSNTIVLPVLISQLCASGSPCLSPANPRFDYTVEGFGLTDDTADTIDGKATFNAFSPAISTGTFDVLAPGGSANETVSINPLEWAQSPARGLMVVSHTNRSGKDEAQLVAVDVK